MATTERIYSILWRKKTTKKHKSWDGDGRLVVTDTHAILLDQDGRDIGKGRRPNQELQIGMELSILGKEIEIVGFLESRLDAPSPNVSAEPALAPPPAPRLPNKQFIAHASAELAVSKGGRRQQGLTPRHNPNAPDAFVLPRPPGAADEDDHDEIVDVVVDPVLARHLRPHQRDGVQFLYECLLGYRMEGGSGAILADEMGLGKTLQCITLIWTLLRQNPFAKDPLAKRVMVVCPASLITNWQKEFKKWLGDERIRTFPVDGQTNVNDFLVGRIYPVMIVGYERLRLIYESLGEFKFDLVVCDEGHRLKNSNVKINEIIKSLNARWRIILSGSPIQNDLSEFFAMIEVVHPGMLGLYRSFKNRFENVIVAGRQPDTTAAERTLASERLAELTALTDQLVLRRTGHLNAQYLPPKTDVLIMCKPAAAQVAAYRAVLDASKDTTGDAEILGRLNRLRKVCNHPALLAAKDEAGDSDAENGSDEMHVGDSSKLVVAQALVTHLLAKTKEKVVLVSNFTSTLDLLERICSELGASQFRLDGCTTVSKRQALVDSFNEPTHPTRVFLLSARAGGLGLNLVGASRLVLVDADWNPSVDQQALARIWRDGQTRPVFLYRLVVAGTLEERIVQRQVTKVELSHQVLDRDDALALDSAPSFSRDELKELFQIDPHTPSWLHESLCGCSGDGLPLEDANTETAGVTAGTGAAVSAWFHYQIMGKAHAQIKDAVMKAVLATDVVRFVMASQALA
ncbi:hypothetical protein AMAG_09199 [Allomyces macrogynus ATCC 38327]|uniref:DNA repair and recombination protein RAD54B n=1 Tax=Allomyces macrogynus (strain ATCC 38327) TaxID=578462 RepID=A0A0L0SNQ5_ALLM3|nr:hypothetical protein AMAG_09199 [Allomyces macrogynus ATCC 38327]|eukprot:KNE64148.1 hypothetical protein AMAG_09199 [Allomyces macrogynus ATCC 38327]